ncbi:MAG: cation diffusion facilitator family transporter [Alphaproteobacteria bacterium]
MHQHKHDEKHKDFHQHHINIQDEKTLLLATIILFIFMIFELIGGVLSGSLILIADAGHMLIDASALALALFAIKISKKPADHKRSYGYERSKVIAALINSFTLIFTTLWIVIESFQRLFNPEPIAGKAVIILAIIGLIVNGFVAMLLARSSTHNINIKSALIHVIGDLLGYVAAIITGIVIIFTNWLQIDSILSFIFAMLMLKSSWSIAKDSIHILMEGTPKEIDIDQVKQELKNNFSEILDIHHVHIWSLTDNNLILTAHLKLPENYEIIIIKRVKSFLKENFNILHSTIEIETNGCAEENH